jgi:aspartate/methionine/tyrosine aminotransferase
VSLLPIHDFALERYFARWEFETPLSMGSSEIEGFRLDELLELADDQTASLWHELKLGYTESLGAPILRSEIATLYEQRTSEEVVVCTGAEEAILLVLGTQLGAGDHVIVVTPCYQSLSEIARAAGADVSTLSLDEERGWSLDVDRVRDMLRRSTRMIIVNFPHNPTGALPDLGSWQALLALADSAGVRVMSDEVYRFLEWDPGDRLPAAADISPTAVSIGVMSKAFALAGLRVGWITCQDRALRRRIAAARDYTTICGAAPSELLASMALRARDAVLARSRAIIGTNLPLLDAFFAERQDHYLYVRPRGGCVAFPRLLADVPIHRFADGLREAEGVLLLPGTLFGDGLNNFRVGVGREEFPEALDRFGRYADRLLYGRKSS